MKAPLRIAWLALLVVTSAACNQVLGIEQALLTPDAGHNQPAPRKTCVLNSHCKTSEMCIFRVCSAPCEVDRDCGGSLQCLAIEDGTACVDPDDNVCDGDDACPNGTRCIDGTCRTRCGEADGVQCPGGQECTNGSCEHVDTTPVDMDGGTRSLGDAGDPGSDAAMSVDTTPDCKKGAKRCEDGALQTCRSDGRWDDGTPCAYACVDGACTGSCVPTDQQCLDNTLQHCDPAGEWQADMLCPSVCTSDGCVDHCKAGTHQCNGLDLLTCTNTGSFKKEKTCDYVCKAGACIGGCVPDSKQCVDGVPQVCDSNGEWQSGDACEFVCSGEECGGECKPADTHCDDALNVRRCGDDGMWGEPSACQYVCDAGSDDCGGECKPDDTQCTDGRHVKACGDDGMWGDPSACTYVCDAGSDDCGGECVPDDTECTDGTHVKQCGSDGAWDNPSPCQYVCDANSDDCGGDCEPGTYSCNNAAPSTSQRVYCNNGSEMPSALCDYPNELCAGGVCAANNATNVGFSAMLPNSSSAGGSLMFGIPIVIDRRVSVLRLGLFGRATATTKVRMALYSDNGGGNNSRPLTLLASSSEAAVETKQIFLTLPGQNVAINPGTYWLVAIYDGSANTYAASAGTGRVVYVSQSYQTAFPSPFPSSGVMAVANTDLNHFLEVRNSL